jgi:hypothetical protein
MVSVFSRLGFRVFQSVSGFQDLVSQDSVLVFQVGWFGIFQVWDLGVNLFRFSVLFSFGFGIFRFVGHRI